MARHRSPKPPRRLNEITHEINSAVEEQASGAQAVVRAMEKMRELVQRSSTGSTELAASSEQMSKMSRMMLESMDRFILENSNNGERSQWLSQRTAAADKEPESQWATVAVGLQLTRKEVALWRRTSISSDSALGARTFGVPI